MSDEKQVSSSFTSMASEGSDVEAPEIGIGMLGYAFMGKAHTNAFKIQIIKLILGFVIHKQP